MAEFDTHEIDLLAGYIERAARTSDTTAAAIVKKGAVKIKSAARKNAAGHTRAPRLQYSITFDVEDGGLTAVIGPDKDKGSGPLATFYEYGSANDAPQPFLAPALDAEVPHFVEQLVKATVEEFWR